MCGQQAGEIAFGIAWEMPSIFAGIAHLAHHCTQQHEREVRNVEIALAYRLRYLVEHQVEVSCLYTSLSSLN